MIADPLHPTWPAQLANRESWAEHERELAYQVWWMRANQNAAEAARLLASGSYGDDPDTPPPPLPIPYRTIAYWVSSHRWHERAAADRAALGPGLTERTLIASGFGLAAGTEWLRAVAEGRAPVKYDRDRIQAVRLLAELEGWVGPDRKHAGQRAGLGREDRVAVDTSTLSDADLLALEQGRMPVSPPGPSSDPD